MKIVCGLGNPGLKYKNTRHNIGFGVIDELARAEDVRFRQSGKLAETGKWLVSGEEILLVKPLTYMNKSGVAIRQLLNRKNIPPEDLLVVCDDFWLPLGKISTRRSGSSGGHNGLDSVIQELGSNTFPRLRIGIGTPPDKDTARYVLEKFSQSEIQQITPVIHRAVSAVCEWVVNGIESAMNKFNSEKTR